MIEKSFNIPEMPSTIDGLFGSEQKFLIVVEEAKRYLELNVKQLSASAVTEFIGRHRDVPNMTEMERREVEEKVTEVLQEELRTEGGSDDEIEEFFTEDHDSNDVPTRIVDYNEKLLRDDHGPYTQNEQ